MKVHNDSNHMRWYYHCPLCTQCPHDGPMSSDPAQNDAVEVGQPVTDATIDLISKALRRAFSLGQTYWQQADSDSWAQNKRSDTTRATFDQLVDETCVVLAKIDGETK